MAQRGAQVALKKRRRSALVLLIELKNGFKKKTFGGSRKMLMLGTLLFNARITFRTRIISSKWLSYLVGILISY